jgi:hypothetical protein
MADAIIKTIHLVSSEVFMNLQPSKKKKKEPVEKWKTQNSWQKRIEE